jgi:hypothetical protein
MRKIAGLAVILLLLALTQTPVAIAGCTAFCDNFPEYFCTGSSTCSSTSTQITCDGRTVLCPYPCPGHPQDWCVE